MTGSPGFQLHPTGIGWQHPSVLGLGILFSQIQGY